jgi:hypothetical protein
MLSFILLNKSLVAAPLYSDIRGHPFTASAPPAANGLDEDRAAE